VPWEAASGGGSRRSALTEARPPTRSEDGASGANDDNGGADTDAGGADGDTGGANEDNGGADTDAGGADAGDGGADGTGPAAGLTGVKGLNGTELSGIVIIGTGLTGAVDIPVPPTAMKSSTAVR
jgi:hypothetical protein